MIFQLLCQVQRLTDISIFFQVVRHFIGTVSYNCKYQSTTIKMEINGENFSYSGKKLTDLGFTKVMTWQAITDEETVPSVSKNDQLELTEVKLAEKQTSPPDYLTEADLITLMEKHGIGTDASIPVHINNICQRNYCTVTKLLYICNALTTSQACDEKIMIECNLL